MRLFSLMTGLLVLFSCERDTAMEEIPEIPISEEAKDYWYQGEAELTSYKLTQARYGELREGTAVIVFVTEDFSKSEFTKVDEKGENTTSVLKMNFMKKFTTGIYPYSIMTSSFMPFRQPGLNLKISTSIQEWCGHVYMEMVRKRINYVSIHSYFEGENKMDYRLTEAYFEDGIYSAIRIDPETVPIGTQQVVPAFSYIRLMHIDPEAYTCKIDRRKADEKTSYFLLNYPELKRTLKIYYEDEYPHQILAWEEEYPDGFGENKKMLKSSGERIETIKLDYWNKNRKIDDHHRIELGLENDPADAKAR